MITPKDLQALAERSGPERSFLSLYLSGPDALAKLETRIKNVREFLGDNEDELEHFEHNIELVQKHLETYDFASKSLCIFSCWAMDYLHVFPFEVPLPDLLWVDSSPYIRPIAEAMDEYETFVVVAADNSDTRIYVVTSAIPEEETRIEGDVKNHVRVGGWSQQRYERRRDKQLLHYAKEIAEVLAEMNRNERFERIFLVGSEETMREIDETLSEDVRAKVIERRSVDLKQEDRVWDIVWEMFENEERNFECSLWTRIREAYMQGGRAVVGPKNVLEAALVGRVDHLIVTRDAKIEGIRCRDCENLHYGTPNHCPVCKSESVFKIDLINELVELASQGQGQTEFADPIEALTRFGDVAALLRY